VITTLVFDDDDMPSLLSAAYPNATESNCERYAPHLLAAAWSYGIHTPLRLAHWLAQLGHESGELKYSEEIASGRAYEGRKDLGNTRPGDGVRFKGRGLIQITGRYNYTRYFRYLGQPELLETPQILAVDPFYAADCAGWFWCHGASVDLNRVADKNNVTLISKLINGGYNGLSDRKRLLTLSRRAVDRQGTRKVQASLTALSVRGSRWPALKVDGLFGPQTASVVREMQGEYMIKPTGHVDVRTWNKIKELQA
jgi:predicted chitinase